MFLSVTGIDGRRLGKIKAKELMNTPYGLIRKVNDSSVYAGENKDFKQNEKYTETFSVPIWFLREDEINTIEYSENKNFDTLSPATKAMILLTQEDHYAAQAVIYEISNYHTSIAKKKHNLIKHSSETEDHELLFDVYNSLNAIGILESVKKITE